MRSKAASRVRIPLSPPFRFASVAQLDRVLGYEPSGRRFESSRMHHLLPDNSEFVVSWSARVSRVPGGIALRQQRPEGRGFAESSSRMHHFFLFLTPLHSSPEQSSASSSATKSSNYDKVTSVYLPVRALCTNVMRV